MVHAVVEVDPHSSLTRRELRLEPVLPDAHVPQHLYLARHHLPPDAREDGAHGVSLDGPKLAVLSGTQPAVKKLLRTRWL